MGDRCKLLLRTEFLKHPSGTGYIFTSQAYPECDPKWFSVGRLSPHRCWLMLSKCCTIRQTKQSTTGSRKLGDPPPPTHPTLTYH